MTLLPLSEKARGVDNDPPAGYDDDISDDEIDRRMAAAGIAPKVHSAYNPPTPAPTQSVAPRIQATTTAALPQATAPSSDVTGDDDGAAIKALLSGSQDDTAAPTAKAASSTPAASTAATAATPDADDAAAQAGRDQSATNKYLKDQGPDDGSKFVVTPDGQGGSRRVVIGHDHSVVAANDLTGIIQSHQANAQQAGLAADQAEQGTAGAQGLGSYGLSDLKQSHAALNKRADDAQGVVDQTDGYMRGGGTLNGHHPCLGALTTSAWSGGRRLALR